MEKETSVVKRMERTTSHQRRIERVMEASDRILQKDDKPFDNHKRFRKDYMHQRRTVSTMKDYSGDKKQDLHTSNHMPTRRMTKLSRIETFHKGLHAMENDKELQAMTAKWSCCE